MVPQLAKWSLFTPEVLSSNPVISKVLIEYFLLSTRHGRDISRGIISRQKSGRVGSRSRSGRPPRLISPIPGASPVILLGGDTNEHYLPDDMD